MSGDRPVPKTANATDLAPTNAGLFAQPEVRAALEAATGLSENGLDEVVSALTRLGVGLVLPNGADVQAKYANAIAPVRNHGFSITRAARGSGCWSGSSARGIR